MKEVEKIRLEPVPNFTPEIGLYLSSLYKIRQSWKEALKDISKAELATKILPNVQPIGTLIIHLAEAEYFWIQQVVGGREFTKEIEDLLHHDLWFKDFAAENLDFDYCLRTLDEIHEMTLKTLSSFNETDVDRFFLRQDLNREYSLRWILVHLLEHEAEHKGQILMIKRLIKENKSN